jgi:uncharacterized BrkB/YihY/UPF0761 family membrane protein
LNEFISDLKSVLSLGALRRVGRRTLDDDCLGLAGQLAFFSLLSLFPFLMFLVALAGLVINDPETVLRTLTERMQDVLPRDGRRWAASRLHRPHPPERHPKRVLPRYPGRFLVRLGGG